MRKIKSFMAGVICGGLLIYSIDHSGNKAESGYRPTAVFEEQRMELFDQIRESDTLFVIEPSGTNYAVDISHKKGIENLVNIGRNNLYYYDGARFKQTDQGYEKSMESFKHRGTPRPWLALLHNDTLYRITPHELYVGFDGLGYQKMLKE